MVKHKVEVANGSHVEELKGKLRESDIEEIRAASGQDPDEALRYAYESSLLAWAASYSGRVACLFGVKPLCVTSNQGVAWLLGSNLVDNLSRGFAREHRKFLWHMLEHFDTIFNYVDVRNIKTMRWLEWMGFEMGEEEPYGIMRMPFRKFWLNKGGSDYV